MRLRIETVITVSVGNESSVAVPEKGFDCTNKLKI